jgi:hypothetical protein
MATDPRGRGGAVRLPERRTVDLPRRGFPPQEAHREEQGRVVRSEQALPVPAPAYYSALWLQMRTAAREDFELDSMRAEQGLIRIKN